MQKVFISLIGLVMLVGCQSEQQNLNDPNSRVILMEAKTFPKEFTGIWYNKQNGWTLKIEENGRLSEIIHTVGRPVVVAGQTSTFPLQAGGQAVVEPGLWFVQYNGTKRELAVEVTLTRFEYVIGGNTVSGSTRDIFIGTLPAKGDTIWRADWLSFPEYVASTADKTYQDYHLPIEEGQEDMGEIIFEKVDPGDLKRE
jgi:hypothetical protein